MTADMTNGAFELLASAFLFLHVRRVWADKSVAGASTTATLFFTAWGFWNLGFYPSQELWWSFWGGVPVVVMNVAWVAGMIRYGRRGCGYERPCRKCRETSVIGSDGLCEPCWRNIADAYDDPTCVACRRYSVGEKGARCEKCIRRGIVTPADWEKFYAEDEAGRAMRGTWPGVTDEHLTGDLEKGELPDARSESERPTEAMRGDRHPPNREGMAPDQEGVEQDERGGAEGVVPG